MARGGWLRLAAVLAVVAAAAAAGADFYEVLGVARDADDGAIKRAYRKLSLKLHPDKNPGDEEAARRFTEVNRAYEVLSDAEKRPIYDLDGVEGLERHEKGVNAPANPFEMLFGGGQGGRRKGQDAGVEMEVTLEELYNGGSRSARINRNIICPKCRGTGAKDGDVKKCAACQGRGVRMVQQQMAPGFVVQMQETCPECGGRGNVAKSACPHCNGRKVIGEEKMLTAQIERGMASDGEVRFERESEQQPGIIPGDVIFKFKAAPHPRFRREGDNLHHDMHLNLREALLGFKRFVRHLDSRDVPVEYTGVTQPFEVRKVAGEGMPVHNFPSQRGDLFIKYIVDLPKTLADDQKAAIATHFQ